MPAAMEAAELLTEDGVSAAVLNARFIKPIDVRWLTELARRCGAIVAIEEHSGMGGFGEAVLSVLAKEGVSARARVVAVPDLVVEHGSAAAIHADFGLDPEGIRRATLELLGR